MIVAGVVVGELSQAQQVLDTQQEAGAPDPTDQNRDLHTARQYCLPTMRSAGAGCGRHDTDSPVSDAPKFGHKMVWKCGESLDLGTERVSNHTSVISRLTGRFQCRRPRFDRLFELRWPHITNSGRHLRINDTS